MILQKYLCVITKTKMYCYFEQILNSNLTKLFDIGLEILIQFASKCFAPVFGDTI